MEAQEQVGAKALDQIHIDTVEKGSSEAWNDEKCTRSAQDQLDSSQWEQQAAQSTETKRKRVRRSEGSILAAFCTWIVDNQIGLSVNLILLLALTHLSFPRARRHTRKFYHLSYHNSETGRYALGWDDMLLVFFYIVVFTGLRTATIEYILAPFAHKLGVNKKKERIRFAEQAWIFIYYTAFWSLGMYIMYHSNYWLNFKNLWVDWPDREMNGLFKWYYLVQFAFCLQQILVVNIEERRKDYVQMFTHHLITCSLMLTSYGYHQTKAGNVVLCVMDCVDIIFPFAKMLKYAKFNTACDVAFGIFMVVWVGTRHVIYPIFGYSVYYTLPATIDYGCYWGSNANLQGPIQPTDTFNHLTMPFRDPEGLVCTTKTTTMVFIGLLGFLQAILLTWFGMIVRVAIKVLQGGEAEDTRSDDEEEDEKVKARTIYTSEPHNEAPLEEEVGVESINLTGRKSSPALRLKKSAGTSSSITLPSERKELLGRIGCDKGS